MHAKPNGVFLRQAISLKRRLHHYGSGRRSLHHRDRHRRDGFVHGPIESGGEYQSQLHPLSRRCAAESKSISFFSERAVPIPKNRLRWSAAIPPELVHSGTHTTNNVPFTAKLNTGVLVSGTTTTPGEMTSVKPIWVSGCIGIERRFRSPTNYRDRPYSASRERRLKLGHMNGDTKAPNAQNGRPDFPPHQRSQWHGIVGRVRHRRLFHASNIGMILGAKNTAVKFPHISKPARPCCR